MCKELCDFLRCHELPRSDRNPLFAFGTDVRAGSVGCVVASSTEIARLLICVKLCQQSELCTPIFSNSGFTDVTNTACVATPGPKRRGADCARVQKISEVSEKYES